MLIAAEKFYDVNLRLAKWCNTAQYKEDCLPVAKAIQLKTERETK